MAIEGMAKFDPRARSQSIGCMRMGLKPGTSEADRGGLRTDDADLDRFVDNLLADGIFTGSTATDSRTGMEVNTCAQFRDVFDMDSAAYRAIVSSRTQHGNIRNLEFFSGDDTVLEFLWSDSFEGDRCHVDVRGASRAIRSLAAGSAKPPHARRHGHAGSRTGPWKHMPVEVATGDLLHRRCPLPHRAKTLHTYGQTP
jgi:hypothetical protein